jgi:hypothetical protein
MLQMSQWRVKTANTILQIPWKKVKSYANTPTWTDEVKILQIHNERPEYVKKYHSY